MAKEMVGRTCRGAETSEEVNDETENKEIEAGGMGQETKRRRTRRGNGNRDMQADNVRATW